jgi:hypothetical protein
MDSLEELISKLTKKECKQFEEYLQRKYSDRMDVKLLNLLSKEKPNSDWDIPTKLYRKNDCRSNYTLRSRLKERLLVFIALNKYEQSLADNKAEVYLSCGDFFLERNSPDIARSLFDNAEEIAIKEHQSDTLEYLYNKELIHAVPLKIDLDKLKPKWQVNMENHLNMHKLNAAHADVHKELAENRRLGQTMDPKEFVQRIFKEFRITRIAFKNARFMLRLAEIYRAAIVSSKAYPAFEPYLIRVYNNLKKMNAFNGVNSDTEINFIYMISHTLYRNQKFVQSDEWLKRMEIHMPRQKLMVHKLYPKYVGLLAGNLSYTGKNAEAIQLIETVLHEHKNKLQENDRYDLKLNLSVYHFQAKNFPQAHVSLRTLHKGDKYTEQLKGLEWRFKKDMIEAIILVELGKVESAYQRLEYIGEYYNEFFTQPAYKFARIFVKLVRKILDNPDCVTSEEFALSVKKLSEGWPGERNDIQAITFFCWLKSKMEKRDYYEVLIEWMKGINA